MFYFFNLDHPHKLKNKSSSMYLPKAKFQDQLNKNIIVSLRCVILPAITSKYFFIRLLFSSTNSGKRQKPKCAGETAKTGDTPHLKRGAGSGSGPC